MLESCFSGLISCPREVVTCLTTSRLLDTLGNTPLLELRSVSWGTGCRVLGKAEFMNPGGSIKDRLARFLVERAEARGELKRGQTILEVTSGNTGIALAMVGAIKGYKVVLVMPKTVSRERLQMIRSFGAEIRLIERIQGIEEAVKETCKEAASNVDIFLPRQFSNSDNVLCHQTTTGAEILRQVSGRIDAFVMGVGTGGTLMGVGRALRRARQNTRLVAVEPAESAVLSGGNPGEHGIQGLADGFIPELVVVDEIGQVVAVTSQAAGERAQRLALEEGLLVGISAGANVVAAERLARELGPGHTIVTVLPDRGERYLSLGASAV